ncbi:unnamed protein product [Diabrotica balteata]|uniref:Uncharacterized protein n=1 Tax=Diabrotica balteata TaxID=107213 RepID=A0A9N9XDK0_DIABA|nr:unnamed protein product [Diabrotica balteata]
MLNSPDLVDFAVTMGLPNNHLRASSCYDLSSDYSPVLIEISSEILYRTPSPILTNKSANWEQFIELLTNKLELNISLKKNLEIDNAIETLNQYIQEVAWESTTIKEINRPTYELPNKRKKITSKRILIHKWHLLKAA